MFRGAGVKSSLPGRGARKACTCRRGRDHARVRTRGNPPQVGEDDREAFILAGGQSRRMGSDKSRARIGRRTMLSLVVSAAKQAGLRARIVRRDSVARCGPMGGVVTALRRSRAEVVVFLSCDMPFVPPAFVRRVAMSVRGRTLAAFTVDSGAAGFPFALRREAVHVAETLITRGEFSLQALARATRARRIRPGSDARPGLMNVNTRTDLTQARRRATDLHGGSAKPGRARVR